jgi:LmbE family N-acetylglucosaminyl deacetylase
LRRVLAIAAHPDDETLGCGGGLLKHAAAGDELHWLIVTSPAEPQFDQGWAARRAQEIVAVSEAYAMETVSELGLPSTRLDSMSLGAIIEPMREVILRIAPDIVYLVHGGDIHSDHRQTFDAAMAVLKPFKSLRPVTIYCYECSSSTNVAAPMARYSFLPQVYCDISEFVERKLEILSIFETEIFPPPHPRSLDAVRALARYRGTTVSVDYAEAYMLIRQML